MVKNPPANTGDTGDRGSIPGLGQSPGEGNGNPLQILLPGNPMNTGAWQATLHGVAKSQIRLNHHHHDLKPYHVVLQSFCLLGFCFLH